MWYNKGVLSNGLCVGGTGKQNQGDAMFEQRINIDRMEQAAARLLGTHDFRAFSSYRRTKKSTVRTLEQIRIERRGEELRLEFTGNGFLYHMVRILAGTLIEVGLHKKSPEEMDRILVSLDREQAGFTAPAQGLCLVSVEYADGES